MMRIEGNIHLWYHNEKQVTLNVLYIVAMVEILLIILHL